MESLKVWDNTKIWQLAMLTLFSPLLLYLAMKDILRYYRRKALIESGIDAIDTMSVVEFEELLLAHYINLGYTGEITKKICDY